MKFDAEDRFYERFAEDSGSFAEAVGRLPRVPRRLALIGCFRPRQCGIATFTADIYDHVTAECPNIAIDVYAMSARPGDAVDPATELAIGENDAAAYRAAADAINRSGADAIWLQHEFGIFGGEAGDMVFELLDRVAAPLIVTLHTVLAEPNNAQRRAIERLVARASRLVVMSEYGRQTLIDVYCAPPAAVVQIEHGTPDRSFVERSPLRDALGYGDRPILSTFGLLGPGKGLETAIRALPAIAAQYPEILYRIVGATHPNLRAAEGEAYRESLEALAESLGVAGNIAWDNRFLASDELLEQIELCDIYLAPYPNLAQVTSGTLAYAVALGRAVISTPFVHARELLAGDVGILVPQSDSDAIAEAALLMLAVPEERHALQARAYARGRQTAWPQIARACAAVVDAVVVAPARIDPLRAAPSFRAIWAMSDDVGILQHGNGPVPDRTHGYCIDDNARALMLVNEADNLSDGDYATLTARYASFVQHAWNPERGLFRNFMGYNRDWLEEAGSDDSNGRALWSLGHCAGRARSDDLAAWGASWFARAAPMMDKITSPRALGFAMLGADALLDRFPGEPAAVAILERGEMLLSGLLNASRRPGWTWFEAGLSYDNARLPEALIRAGRRLRSLPLEEAGIAALEWLCAQQTSAQGLFRPMGSEGFGADGELFPFDQQPLEAWATVAACGAAYESTGLLLWGERAETAYRWFLGANDRGIALANSLTGRCCDGLTPRGVNVNVGAESVLAFHLAYQTMRALFWSGNKREKAGLANADLQTRPVAPAYTR